MGDPPDPRSIAIAHRHGIDITHQRARKLASRDFETFDLILAMDADNLAFLPKVCPSQQQHRLHLFASYALGRPVDVPDPYYGRNDGFESVYTMLFAGCKSIVENALADRCS